MTVDIITASTFITWLSAATIATDRRVRIGGVYYMVSRPLGVESGGAIGLPLYMVLAFSAALSPRSALRRALQPSREFSHTADHCGQRTAPGVRRPGVPDGARTHGPVLSHPRRLSCARSTGVRRAPLPWLVPPRGGVRLGRAQAEYDRSRRQEWADVRDGYCWMVGSFHRAGINRCGRARRRLGCRGAEAGLCMVGREAG